MKTHPAVPLHKQQKGFTLIELIVVLVILGILAAFAIPRFAGVNSDARRAAVQGLAGSLRSSTALVHGLSLARNVTNDTTGLITLEGQAIDIVNGYPAAAGAKGIAATVLNMEGFVVNNSGLSATQIGYSPSSLATSTTCRVVYTEAAPGSSAAVTQDVSNCG